MKIKKLSILCCLAICCLFATVACHEDAVLPTSLPDETGSLTLQFQLTPASVTRGDGSGVTELFYTVQDGELVPCEAPKAMPTTKAISDSVVADGGGMADLHVFLVDAADNIVARQSFSYSTNPTTTQVVTFRGLTRGATYTAYAYANTDAYIDADTEKNYWFTMPEEDETSFAAFKKATLKPLDEGEAPTITNGRMPLTGKQEFTITSDNLDPTIEMLRPVARLEVNVFNYRTATDFITVGNIDFGSLFPETGYVFQHDDMCGAGKFSLASTEEHPVLSGSSHVVLNTLLYETTGSEIKLSMKYSEADVISQETTDKVQNVPEEMKLVIKLVPKDSDNDAPAQYLALETNDGGYNLVLESSSGLESNSMWELIGNGANQSIYNVYHKVYLWVSNGAISFPGPKQGTPSRNDGYTYKWNSINSDGTFFIGTGENKLTYNNNNNPPSFEASDTGSLFQFYTYEEGEVKQCEPTDILTESREPLTAIYRNQHVKINIVFPKEEF